MIYPVLATVPDFTTDPKQGLVEAQDKLAIAMGRGRVAFPNLQPDHVFAFKFTLDSLAEIRAVKQFFAGRGGRAHPFYLPTWRNDLPAQSGNFASTLLTVSATDYEADHLTEPDTRPDHYGRQIFVWQPNQALFTTRVISATESTPGTTVLDLEQTLPFTINPATAVCGFLHLARFLDDRISWDHSLPDIASAELKFRGIRQHITVTQTNPVEGTQIFGLQPLVSVTQSPEPSEPSDNRAAYAAGPINLHASQDELYFTRWAVWTYDRKVRIKRLATGEITFPDSSGTTSGLFGSTTVATDHITLAFDQNAWEVIAYQKTAGTIELRQFFNSEVTVRTWEGIDPVLVFDQLIDPNLEDGDSDVVCYYLKPGKNLLFVRIQRENFGTERIAAQLPLRPLALKRSWMADQKQHIELLDAGFRKAVIETDEYPDPPPPDPPPPEIPIDLEPETAGGTIELAAIYSNAVVYADGLPFDAPHPPFEETSEGRIEHGGAYIDVTFEAEAGEEHSGGQLEHGGVYTQVVLSDEEQEAAGGSLSFDSITNTLIVQSPPPNEEPALGEIQITATYEAL